MTALGRAAERRSDERAARSMRAVQGDLRVFALSGRAMIAARGRGEDLDAAVADEVGWTRFEAAVARAEALCGPELIDPTAELVARHKSVRVFAPRLLDTFAFEGSPEVQDLMAALDLIRTTYRDGTRWHGRGRVSALP